MNIYVLVEGKGEKSVYKHWIPIVNPNLEYVDHVSAINSNNFSIVSAMGYPAYLEAIDHAVEDVSNNEAIDRLVVAIDSEEMTRFDKYDEVENRILSRHSNVNYKIIVQHFCLEAWALGNRRIISALPQDTELRKFKNIYDVRKLDPESLPAFGQWNRAQFAYQYLRAAFRNKWGGCLTRNLILDIFGRMHTTNK